MNAKLLQDHIDPFIRKFKKLNADAQQSTLVVFAICDELQKTIANKSYDKAILSDLNGTQSLLGETHFTPTLVNEKTLPALLSLNDFLYYLKSFPLDQQNTPTQSLLKLLEAYRVKNLLVGLNNYKESCLLIDKPNDAKKKLLSVLTAIKATLQSDIDQYRKAKLSKAINEKDEQYNISKIVGKSLIDQAKATILENSALLANDEFIFLDELENLIKKPRLSYRDIYALKNSSLAFQNLALSLPNVQKVTQYHWLINFLINLMNKFIVLVGSDKTKKIKQIFTCWQTNWINTAEKEINNIDQQIYIR